MPQRIELGRARAFRVQAFVLAGGDVAKKLEGEGARLALNLDVLAKNRKKASNDIGLGHGQKLRPTFYFNPFIAEFTFVKPPS